MNVSVCQFSKQNKLSVRFAEEVFIGDEVMIQENGELTTSSVINITQIEAQGNKYCKIINFFTFTIFELHTTYLNHIFFNIKFRCL